MSEKIVSPRVYVAVYVALVLLTLATVGISFLPLGESMPQGWLGAGPHTLVGLTIAACKAALVALFFMGALYTNRLNLVVIFTGMFWLAILFVLILSDYLTRGWMVY
jgi:cytochrome c oxidase subunit 4